jgi:hypothetical protein
MYDGGRRSSQPPTFETSALIVCGFPDEDTFIVLSILLLAWTHRRRMSACADGTSPWMTIL